MTPLASEAGAFSRSDSSQSEVRAASPLSTTISTTSGPSQFSQNVTLLPAEVGLSSLKTEQQLRDAASGKDRMFLLILAKEIETFVSRVSQDESPTANIPLGTPSSSILASMSASMMVQSSFMSSKYQRMLAYKVAEWYGLKGVAGPDGSIIIGVVGAMNPKA